jgi:hypothetical protein
MGDYSEGFDLGVRDVRTGGMTLICGDPEAVAQRVAGYQAGRRWAAAHPDPQRERAAELELELELHL